MTYNSELLLNDITQDEPLDCCFTHMIGCPSKDFVINKKRITVILPIFNWQEKLFNAFQAQQDNLLIKATGIGASELKLRETQYSICSGYDYYNTQVVLIVGPEAGLAKTMLRRYKDLFPFIITNDQNTAVINNCWMHVYASRNIAGIRSLKNPRELILDEFDFMPLNDMTNVFETIFRYFAKSGAKINAMSTVNRSFGYLYTLEHDETQRMNIIKIPYHVALGSLFTLEQIEQQKQKFGFDREYRLIYGGSTGNFFDAEDIKAAITEYEAKPLVGVTSVMGIDTGFGSSYFAILILSHVAGKLYVMHSERHKRPDPQSMLQRIMELRSQFFIHRMIVDGSDPAFIYLLKDRMKDYPPVRSENNFTNAYDYHSVPKERLHEMKVIPTNFSGKPMIFLMQINTLLKQRMLKINPKFNDVIQGLNEVYIEGGRYNKAEAEFNDITDCLSEAVDFFVLKTVPNL